MTARASYASQQINSGLQTERHNDRHSSTSSGREDNRSGTAKYLHVKDLQAKAEAEAKELGAHTPVLAVAIPPGMNTC